MATLFKFIAIGISFENYKKWKRNILKPPTFIDFSPRIHLNKENRKV